MKQWRGCCWIGLVINACASWRIQAGSRIADRTTIWSFADRIGEAGATAIFKEVTRQLLGKGYRANSGQIIDTSLVRVPRQRFSQSRKEELEQAGKTCRINRKGGTGRKLTAADKAFNGKSNRVRARIEHVFGIVKNLWGYRKVRYKGLAKNRAQVLALLALANFYRFRDQLV